MEILVRVCLPTKFIDYENSHISLNVWLLLKDFPKLVWWKLDQIINITSKQADHYEYEMSVEDKAELARLQENIQRNRQIIAQDNQIIAQDNQIISTTRNRIDATNERIAKLDKLSGIINNKKK